MKQIQLTNKCVSSFWTHRIQYHRRMVTTRWTRRFNENSTLGKIGVIRAKPT